MNGDGLFPLIQTLIDSYDVSDIINQSIIVVLLVFIFGQNIRFRIRKKTLDY